MSDTAQAPQIRRGRKFDQVLEGARTIFLRDGFEGASVDDIAREAGVSKATLYSYFPDKRLMFLEVSQMECRRQADEAIARIDFTQRPEIVLTQAATQLMDFLLSDLGEGMFRMVVAEGERFPAVGQAFYASGPGFVHQTLMAYLEASMARGELQIDDIDLAAHLFAEMCKADLHPKMLCCCCGGRKPDDAAKARVAKGAVDMFMARYGTKA